jgi:hypothetical protein
MSQAVMMIGAVEIAVDLRAKETLRDRMIRVPLDSNGAAMLHGRDDGARVRTIVWTRAADSAVVDQGEGGAHGS